MWEDSATRNGLGIAKVSSEDKVALACRVAWVGRMARYGWSVLKLMSKHNSLATRMDWAED